MVNGCMLTCARRDERVGLLVASFAAIAAQAGDALLARTLAARLVADLARRADHVTVALLNNTINSLDDMKTIN